MSTGEFLETKIDESKQGEVLQLSKNKNTSRKMYIESYATTSNAFETH